MFRHVKKLHFVGIGGIGMSGIAELLINQGFKITGSDINDSKVIQNLKDKGAEIFKGHHTNNITDADVLVYSSAVNEDNPEIIAAHKKNIPIIRRAEMLGELIALKETSIGVAGTHGKTSTSSMAGAMLSKAKLDPTLVVGGLVRNINTNSLLGDGDIIVVEADEFDRSFLSLQPTIGIITNIELEHTDCYEDLDDLQNAFTQFANASPFYGAVIIGNQSPAAAEIIPNIKRPVVTFGLSKESDFYASDIIHNKSETTFTVYHKDKNLGVIHLKVPGEHNVLNALASVALGIEMNIPFHDIAAGLESYRGVRRRFDIKGEANGIMVVDDYAHHPTEVRVTLKSAKNGWNRRIIGVFQPHLYSRTRAFYQEFAIALMETDILVVTDVFPAREKPIEGVNGKMVADFAKDSGHKNVFYIENLENLEKKLDNICQSNDMIITIGAGNIWRYAESYMNHLNNLEEAA
ncbi:MAG: UDP-N-acetylmuramate--L-alanine ligase [Candidatus Marinimicrobia bacterium]|nr:UDP-N-acetylmuramate--L-alanine ligase [Candidatus Neomarinimicrobiota bacterium]